MRAVTQPILAEIPHTDLDPAGFGYAGIQSVTDDQGAATDPSGRSQPLGTGVDTCRTLYPGDRVVLHCWGNDSHGRELRWWLHPQGSGRLLEVRGDRVELTWIVQPRSVGDRVYAGVGMAADSLYHRHGGPGEEGMTDGSSSTTACNPSPGRRWPRAAAHSRPAGPGARAVAHRPRQPDEVPPGRRGGATVTRS